MAKYRVLDPVLVGDTMCGVGDEIDITDAGYAAYMLGANKITASDSPAKKADKPMALFDKDAKK